MPDFSRHSNYNEETGFTSVVFGAGAPVLEVELNEMQQILNRKLGLFFKSLGDVVLPLSEDISSVSGNTITLKNCAIVCDGTIVYVKETSVEVDSDIDSGYTYLRVEDETDVTHNTVLKSCGDNNGSVIENPIMDNRNPMETTRRKLVKYELVFSEVELTRTNEYKYVLVSNVTRDSITGELKSEVVADTPVTSSDLKNYQPITGLLADATVEE